MSWTNSPNYAEHFAPNIEQQYARELTSIDLESNKKYKWVDAQTIKIPTVELSGYKDHVRDGSVNKGSVSNVWTPYALTHDRDISFFVDEADIIETNQALSAANITATFNDEQAIPELDAYRYSKILSEVIAHGKNPITTALTASNILTIFDQAMVAMDEKNVPMSGRKLKVTPVVNAMLKEAEKVSRMIMVGAGSNQRIDRRVHELDEVVIQVVPSDRLQSAYDFTDGFEAALAAKQINFILYHNSAIIAPRKISDIYLWGKGASPQSAFGHLYQNRSYHDLFVIKQKVAGVEIHRAE